MSDTVIPAWRAPVIVQPAERSILRDATSRPVPDERNGGRRAAGRSSRIRDRGGKRHRPRRRRHFAREGARIAGFDRVRAAGDGSRPRSRPRAPSDRSSWRATYVSGGRRARGRGGRLGDGRIDVLVTCAGVREIGDVYTFPPRSGRTCSPSISAASSTLPVRGAADAGDRGRRDRQPLVGGRVDRPVAPAGLHGREARCRRAYEEPARDLAPTASVSTRSAQA